MTDKPKITGVKISYETEGCLTGISIDPWNATASGAIFHALLTRIALLEAESPCMIDAARNAATVFKSILDSLDGKDMCDLPTFCAEAMGKLNAAIEKVEEVTKVSPNAENQPEGDKDVTPEYKLYQAVAALWEGTHGDPDAAPGLAWKWMREIEDRTKDLEQQVEWWGNLVQRAHIGTKDTPSLRAYVERLEGIAEALGDIEVIKHLPNDEPKSAEAKARILDHAAALCANFDIYKEAAKD